VPSLIATRVRAYLDHFQIDGIGASHIEEDSLHSYKDVSWYKESFLRM